MDSETAKERIADAIDSLIPEGMIREKWLRGEALAMNMPYATLRRYHGSGNPRISDNECAAGAYLSMCAQWPAFHEKVTGTTETPPPDLAKLAAHLEATLKALGQRDEAKVIAADFAQRTGHK